MSNSPEDVLIALRRIMRATDLYSRRLSKESGLTAPQLLILQAVAASGELTMGEIASEVSLSQATVTTILDRLEKRGLLTRTRGEQDKRRVYARLTDEGNTVVHSAPTPLQEEFTKRFGELQDWEQSLILSSLQRVASMMNAEGIDASPVLDVGAIDRQQTPIELSEQRRTGATPEATQKQRDARRKN